MAKDTPKPPTQLFLFKGSAYAKGKRYAMFVRVEQAEIDVAATLVFDRIGESYTYNDCRKSPTVLRPGVIYEVSYPEGKQGESIYTNTLKYHGEWPDKNVVFDLNAKERGLVASYEAEAEDKKAAKRDPLKRQLKPVRQAYLNAVGSNRQQLLAWCVAYIVGALEED